MSELVARFGWLAIASGFLAIVLSLVAFSGWWRERKRRRYRWVPVLDSPLSSVMKVHMMKEWARADWNRVFLMMARHDVQEGDLVTLADVRPIDWQPCVDDAAWCSDGQPIVKEGCEDLPRVVH